MKEGVNLKKVKSLRRKNILFSFFISFLGCVFFILGTYFFKFPFIRSFTKNTAYASDYHLKPLDFFFLGTSSLFFAEIVLSVFSLFVSDKKEESASWKKNRFFLLKLFSLVGALLSIVFQNINFLGDGSIVTIKKLFFVVAAVVINVCLLDFLIQFLDKFGICDGFHLFFFITLFSFAVNFFNSVDFKDKLGEWILCFLFVLLITFLLILINNIKWGVPIESNIFLREEKKVVFANKEFNLEFKLNFSPFYLYYLNGFLNSLYWLLAFLYVFFSTPVSLRGQGLGSKFDHFLTCIKTAGSFKFSNKFFLFFFINKQDNLFEIKNLASFFTDYGWYFVLILFFLLLLKCFVISFQQKKLHLKTKELAEDLNSKGLYIDGLQPGKPTLKLINKIIDKLVLLWFLSRLFLNFLFDNFARKILGTSFIKWSSIVVIAEDLLNQIKTKTRFFLNS